MGSPFSGTLASKKRSDCKKRSCYLLCRLTSQRDPVPVHRTTMQTSDLPVARQSENKKMVDGMRPTDFVNLTTNAIENQEDSIAFFDPIKAVDRQEVAEASLVISRANFSENFFEAEFSGACDVFSCRDAESSPVLAVSGNRPVGRIGDMVATRSKCRGDMGNSIHRWFFKRPAYPSLMVSQLSPNRSRYFRRRLASFAEFFCVREY